MYGVLSAIPAKCVITIKSQKPDAKIIPLRLYIGTQTGRQYVLGRSEGTGRFCFYRLDLISSVELHECSSINFSEEDIAEFCSHVWGVGSGIDDTLARVRMTILVEAGEEHIVQNVYRRKIAGLSGRRCFLGS